jgi:hypothetical protein
MFKASIGIRFRRANSNRGRYSSGGVFQTFSHSAWSRNSLTLSLAGYPAIEYRLQAAGKHFEADDHVRAQRVQPREHLQLPLVVIGVVMLFAEQQHVASDQVGQDLLLADGLRLLIGQDRPAGRRQTGLGLGFCVARCAAVGDQCAEQGAADSRKQEQRELRSRTGVGSETGQNGAKRREESGIMAGGSAGGPGRGRGPWPALGMARH